MSNQNCSEYCNLLKEYKDLRYYSLTSSLKIHLIDYLKCLVSLIDLLLEQICQDGESGCISIVVKSTATKIFNLMVDEPFFILEDKDYDSICCHYHGCSKKTWTYGIKLTSKYGRIVRFRTKNIVAYDGCKQKSLDNLTVDDQHYIKYSITETVSTYSEGFKQLQKYFLELCTQIEMIDN